MSGVHRGTWVRKVDWEGEAGGRAMAGSKGLKSRCELDGELTACVHLLGGFRNEMRDCMPHFSLA